MFVNEETRLVITTADRVVSRRVEEDDTDDHVWEMSSQIPGQRIIGTWEIFKGIWIVLAESDDGKHQILQSFNRLDFELKHSHDTEILSICYIDHGKMIFCAEDGWWMTIDAGTSWQQIALPGVAAKTVIAILAESAMILLAYATDKKIYRCVHTLTTFTEPLVWEVVYDDVPVGKWYPAMSGNAVGVLAGNSDHLIRSLTAGETWQVVDTVDGVIRNIVSAGQANSPVYLVEVEKDGLVKCYWSVDLGDSLIPDVNRVSPSTDAQAVVLTGQSQTRTSFVILGRRTPGGKIVCTLTTDPGAV